ncbi:WYL domain-containing protein [Streptomyces sp. bgisy031]|uniref:WYL domain-containing protein n=1 Tax=Streptomyces sp. bgisy031 TaxID=3413772 RepID=UPI003D75D5E8
MVLCAPTRRCGSRAARRRGRFPGIGEDRTFRLNRVTDVRTLPGSFEPPADLDRALRVLPRLATAPYHHEVAVRVQGMAERIRSRLPAVVATAAELPPLAACAEESSSRGVEEDPEPRFRVPLRVERPARSVVVLASLGRPSCSCRSGSRRGRVARAPVVLAPPGRPSCSRRSDGRSSSKG